MSGRPSRRILAALTANLALEGVATSANHCTETLSEPSAPRSTVIVRSTEQATMQVTGVAWDPAWATTPVGLLARRWQTERMVMHRESEMKPDGTDA
jgi:hypothetical protein